MAENNQPNPVTDGSCGSEPERRDPLKNSSPVLMNVRFQTTVTTQQLSLTSAFVFEEKLKNGILLRFITWNSRQPRKLGTDLPALQERICNYIWPLTHHWWTGQLGSQTRRKSKEVFLTARKTVQRSSWELRFLKNQTRSTSPTLGWQLPGGRIHPICQRSRRGIQQVPICSSLQGWKLENICKLLSHKDQTCLMVDDA